MTVLKPVHPFGDYVALMKDLETPDGVEISSDLADKISNEGVVVGVGPDVGDDVALGDRAIFAPKRYLGISPASGGYGGRTVVIVRKADLVIKLGKTEKFTFDEA